MDTKEKGHLVADCNIGFSSSDCGSLRSFSPKETRKCFTCYGKGHIFANFPNNKVRKSSDEEIWVHVSSGSSRKDRPSEDEMKVLRKLNPDCFWVKKEIEQKKRVFENKRNIKKIVKIVTSSDDESFENFSSRFSFSKQPTRSKSFWKLNNISGDDFSKKEEDTSDDGYLIRSLQKNGKGPFQETRHGNGGVIPY
ncbi:hypothetical protein E3N88_12199 [Mikania micrantha]|uniref:Uncharacterized protein n=1 Tax=Mikania micrantha TaxID=192012 RepID=A0A5N6P4T9_9ASTR|nr:hypothetical protein E3N88_12199 [Mikania micrantha]